MAPKPKGKWCPRGDYHRLNQVSASDIQLLIFRILPPCWLAWKYFLRLTLSGVIIRSRWCLLDCHHYPLQPSQIYLYALWPAKLCADISEGAWFGLSGCWMESFVILMIFWLPTPVRSCSGFILKLHSIGFWKTGLKCCFRCAKLAFLSHHMEVAEICLLPA